VHAGGGVFGNGKQGDGIWMFSLDGTMNPVPPPAPAGPAGTRPTGGPGAGGGAGGAGAGAGPGAGAGARGPGATAGAPTSGLPGAAGAAPATGTARPINRANGEKIYTAACVPCHGEAGAGGHGGGPSLIAGQTTDKIISVTASGKNNMPAFAATYSVDDLRDIADYITKGLAASPPPR